MITMIIYSEEKKPHKKNDRSILYNCWSSIYYSYKLRASFTYRNKFNIISFHSSVLYTHHYARFALWRYPFTNQMIDMERVTTKPVFFTSTFQILTHVLRIMQVDTDMCVCVWELVIAIRSLDSCSVLNVTCEEI